MKRGLTFAAIAGTALAAMLGASGSGAHPTGDGGTPATPDEAGRFVPDLVAILPGTVSIASRTSRRGPRTLLAFSASVANNGAGPMIVRTRRGGAGFGVLAARQVVTRTDGRRELAGGTLRLRFVRGGGHSHFHLEDFMRYELRTVGGRSLRRDRKTGFCLGDRYDATGPARMPGEPASPVFRSSCGRNRPTLTSLTEGISVGFGDDYPAVREGQFVDVTGLPSGRYVLVLRVDPMGKLLDLHEDNDASSMLVRIDRGGTTRARILSWCPSTDSCTTAGRHRRLP
ncbi:MAG TPA: lysyl oxidase family protein [Thermoleophilaceae bacterium]|jgi:hypothetical protein